MKQELTPQYKKKNVYNINSVLQRYVLFCSKGICNLNYFFGKYNCSQTRVTVETGHHQIKKFVGDCV